MRTLLCLFLLGTALPGAAQFLPNLGGQRAGISALTFLKMDVSPRAAAMGGTPVAMEGDAYALQWNPAAAADLSAPQLALSNTFWVAGLNLTYASFTLPNKRIGHFGISAGALTTDAMERRTEFQPNGTGEYFTAHDLFVGVSYARSFTDRFSFGANLKYVNETLDQLTAHTVVVDLGFAYRVNWKDLRFALVMQNFGPNSQLNGNEPNRVFNPQTFEIDDYPAPTVFRLGISAIPLKKNGHKLLTHIQLNHPNDNAENIRIGLEYGYRDFLFFRTGYKVNVQDHIYPTLGLGVATSIGRHRLVIDYAVEPIRFLGWRNRVGVSVVFNRDKRDDPAPAEEAPVAEPSSTQPAE